MPNHFLSAFRRIERAKEHINDLKSKTKPFLNGEILARVIEPDPDGIHEIHKARLIKPLPAAFEDITADAVNCLRSALDHACHAAGRLASGKPNPKSAYFPFARDATELANVTARRCRDLPQEIIALACALKPYKGGNDLLWVLNELANASKHRTLVQIGINSRGVKFKYLRFQGTAPIPRWDSTKNEVVYLIATRDPAPDYKLNLAVFIAFGDFEVVGGAPVESVLQQLSSDAESIVWAIEAETKRLGLIS